MIGEKHWPARVSDLAPHCLMPGSAGSKAAPLHVVAMGTAPSNGPKKLRWDTLLDGCS